MRRSQFLAGVAASATAARFSSLLRINAYPFGHDIDPYRDAEIGVDEVAWLYGDGLVGWTGDIVPLLADRIPELMEGGRRVRYHLRRAIWHDGKPFEAQDVARALSAVRKSGWALYEPYRWIQGDLVVRGKHEFDVLLDSPRPRFTRTFFGAYGTPALPLLRLSDDGKTPIGTGPFRVSRRPEPERWRLERFNASPRGAPAVDAIELRLVPDGYKVVGPDVDIVLPVPSGAVAAERFRHIPRITSTAVLIFNTSRLFSDGELRRTFAHAANMVQLQHAYDPPKSQVVASLLLTGRNDAQLAASLAFDAAARDRLQTVLRGREPIFALISGNAHHAQLGLTLAQNLPGVSWQMKRFTAAAYRSEVGPLRTGEFDIGVTGLVYDEQPDFAADWSCSNGTPAAGNFSRWCDEQLATAIARNDSVAALRRLYTEMPCIPITRAHEDIGLDPRVTGFEPPHPLTVATYGCARWSIR